MIGSLRTAAALLALAAGVPAPASAQATAPLPFAMAVQPDPHDFVTRADTALSAYGYPLRFAGMGLRGLALRAGPGGTLAIPTEYETADLLKTVQALGSATIRSASLGITAGCAECLMPASGTMDPAALKRLDHLLRLAKDVGLRVIIPLAGGADGCPPAANAIAGTACAFARWHGLPPAAFYTDNRVRGDFAAAVVALLKHVNAETGIEYRNDPTIAAWENCDDCGRGIDAAAAADWAEFLGRTIKAVDSHHLYENGALAGRITAAPAGQLALPSVDIVGDVIAGHPELGADRFAAAFNAVTTAGRVYLIDSYDWTAATWPTADALEAFIDALVRARGLTGAFVSNLNGHASQGGYLPAPAGDAVPLYFPGFALAGMSDADVQARARSIRRLSYKIVDLLAPIAFANAPPPQIISVVHGLVSWRGAVGASAYSVDRSQDVTQFGSWVTLCDKCAAGGASSWQDTAPPAGPVWYRVTPFNANMHGGLPSAAVANQ